MCKFYSYTFFFNTDLNPSFANLKTDRRISSLHCFDKRYISETVSYCYIMLVNADTFTISSSKRLGLVYFIFSTIMFAVGLAKSEGAALLLLDPVALSSHHRPTENK